MPLEDSRNAVVRALDLGKAEGELMPLAQKWFADYKAWEKNDDFETAFRDCRMTARVSDREGTAEFKVTNALGDQSSVRLNIGAMGVIDRLNAYKFIHKEKNKAGLHALSAVLLKPDIDIGKQLFAPYIYKVVIFAPIPQEEDLLLFSRLSAEAKRNRQGDLHKLVIFVRANMTRISMGAAEDMAVGFADISSAKGEVHIRYGHANVQGKPLDANLVSIRTQNALKYKSAIALVNTKGGNNEVLVKYRAHAGGFPYFGNPDEGKFTCASGKVLIGAVDQKGKFTPVPSVATAAPKMVGKKVVGRNATKK